MMVHPHKHSQRHVEFVSFIRCVKCNIVSKIFIRSSATCVRPKDVSYTVICINVIIIEELWVYLLHFLEEIQKFLDIIFRLFSGKLLFPAFSETMQSYLIEQIIITKRMLKRYALLCAYLFTQSWLVCPMYCIPPDIRDSVDII